MSDGDWLKKGVPASAIEKPAAPRRKSVTRPLTPQEIEACEAILAGDTPRVAFRREVGKKSSESFRRFVQNGETQAYLAARRMEARMALMGEDAPDPAVEWLEHVRTAAYWDPIDLALETVNSPRDIAKLPPHVRKLITGMGYDRHGNFTVKFEDRKAAKDMLARYFGLYQEDRKNDADSAADLLQNVFWRFVMNLHLQRGMSIAEAHTLARREPEMVKEWGRARKLLPPGDSGDASE